MQKAAEGTIVARKSASDLIIARCALCAVVDGKNAGPRSILCLLCAAYNLAFKIAGFGFRERNYNFFCEEGKNFKKRRAAL